MLTRTMLALGAFGLTAACQPSDIPDKIPDAGANAAAAAPKRLPVKPSGVPATAGVVVQSGDSIGAGDGAEGNWAAIEHLGLPPGVKVHNVSHNGWMMLFGLGRREQDVFPLYDKQHASVLVIEDGSNDLANGSTGDALYNNILKPYVHFSQAAGFYVVVNTVLPRGDAGTRADPRFERERQAYNKLVRANSIGADAINDLAADPEIGDGKDPAASLLYADGVHLRKEGQQRIAKIEAKTIATLLECPPRAPTAP